MRSKLLLIVGCIFLAACADIKETGISRSQAITIAKQSCPEYPNQFAYVDRAEWVPEKGYWTVLLDDQSTYHGRIYNINRNGEVVGTQDIKGHPPVYYGGPYYGAPGPYYGGPGPYYGDPYYGGPYYGYGAPVVVGVYGGGGYHHRW